MKKLLFFAILIVGIISLMPQIVSADDSGCKQFCIQNGYVGGKCYFGGPPAAGCGSTSGDSSWAYCDSSKYRTWIDKGLGSGTCNWLLLQGCWCASCQTNSSCAPAPQTCSQKGGSCCSGAQTCSGGKISGASDCTECCGSTGVCIGCTVLGDVKPHKQCIDTQCVSVNTCGPSSGPNSCITSATCAPASQTCSQKGGSCCSGAQTCSGGKISGASDCTECCGSTGVCIGCTVLGDVKPHKQCIDTQCVSVNTCGPNSCPLAGCAAPPQACSWQSGSCGGSCSSTQKQQTCGPTGCAGGACTAGQTQCIADSSCSATPLDCKSKSGTCCSGGKYCSSGKISGASDCTECCPVANNCVSGCALSVEDSDVPTGGDTKNWNLKGICKQGSSCTGLTTKGTDSCSADGKTLTEWYIDGTICESITHDCSPDTCSDGKCVSTAPPTQKCGNPPGFLDSGEQCDTTNLNNNTCQSLALGFTGGTLKCKSDCTFDTSSCTGTVIPPTNNCPSLDGLITSGITISGFAWNESAKQRGQCQFEWNGKVIPGFPSMASNIAVPYEWMIAAGFPSKLNAANPSEVRKVLDEWHQLSFINNRLRYRAKYITDHQNLGEILSILSSPTGGICSGTGICDMIRKLMSEEPLKALDLKLVIFSYNELKLHRAMTECVLAGRCPPHTYGSWGYLLLGKCPTWKGADAKPADCYWPEQMQL